MTLLAPPLRHPALAAARPVASDGEDPFRPARKAHPALQVQDLPAIVEQLRGAGVAVRDDEPLEGYDRVYVDDPFGNRLELLEPRA